MSEANRTSASNPIQDGGPAFPRQIDRDDSGVMFTAPEFGMSLRAWLAGQALAGFCSTLTGQDLILAGSGVFPTLAKMAVVTADHTLKELGG